MERVKVLGVSVMLAVVASAAPAKPLSMEAVAESARDRMAKEMRQRETVAWYVRYQAYTAKLLDDSAGTNAYRDKTGNCRLAWFDRLLRNQLEAPTEAERFSRELHGAASARSGVFEGLVRQGLEKTDVKVPPARKDRGDGLELLTNSLVRMAEGRARAFAPFSPGERETFLALVTEQALGGTNQLGHRLNGVLGGRLSCNGLEKMDRQGLATAALEAARLADAWREGRLDTWLDSLGGQAATDHVDGVEGALAAVFRAGSGLVVVGGIGTNTYRLDRNHAIAAVIDLGGDDRYEEGAAGEGRPVLVILDRAGNDVYAGKQPGIQGAALGGVSVLLEGGGNDRYEAIDLAQGSCIAGVGILADIAGDDFYFGDRRAQGSAMGGIGVLWDGAGADRYRAANMAQGMGGPLGFGLLDDLTGNDSYYAGGKYPGGYDDSPGFGGWSQGVGIGPRGSGNGGVGVLLDGGGDDEYEYDYFCHGGGYWFAVGIARDFGGNDSRVGSTRTNWDGTPRTVKPFVRWGPAYGCHFALGFLFDDAGNDLYRGTTAGVAFAWDIALGVLFDAAGNDRYEGGTGGHASQSSVSMLVDGGGDDTYKQAQPGWAPPVSEYHPAVSNSSNFAFTYDMGGQDTWACGLTNGTSRVQGWAGGWLIDR